MFDVVLNFKDAKDVNRRYQYLKLFNKSHLLSRIVKLLLNFWLVTLHI